MNTSPQYRLPSERHAVAMREKRYSVRTTAEAVHQAVDRDSVLGEDLLNVIAKPP